MFRVNDRLFSKNREYRLPGNWKHLRYYTFETIDEDDLVTERTKVHYTLEDWQKTWMAKLDDNCLFISALNKENLDEFKDKVFEEVKKIHISRFPYNDFLYQEYE